MSGILVVFFFVLVVGGGIIAGIAALAHHANVSADVRVSGTLRHEHSGTVRYEHTGSVQHTHRHVHEIDPSDRARLDRMAAQRELDDAAELHRIQSTRWSVPIEQSARRELTAGPDGVYR